MDKYDVIIIGTGPAGLHAAIQSAKLGKRVAAVERQRVIGGVCVNTGTIPSKAVREAVLYLTGIRQRDLYGSSYTLKTNISMEDITARSTHVITMERDVIQGHFNRNHIDLLFGTASFVSPHKISVETIKGQTDTYEADNFIICVGTRPATSTQFAIDGVDIHDADSILQMKQLPSSLTVVGAGVIGVEYACMFAALGVPVKIIEVRRQFLEHVDEEVAQALQYHMRDMEVSFLFGEKCETVHVDGCGKVEVELESRKRVKTDAVLYAIGRMGNTESLNLQAAGINADSRGRIAVNENYQTEAPHVYAAGDVIGFPSLASVSMEQGRVAACHAFGVPSSSAPQFFPYGIFTIPEISYVGKNEQELTEERVPYATGTARYRESARGMLIGDNKGMLKLLFNREDHKLLGVQIIGEEASELVHIGQAVMAFGGTIEYFVNTVFNYPTLAECYKRAAFNGLNKLT